MDKRELKKHILYTALYEFSRLNLSDYALTMILDGENPTDAQRRRFRELLQEMVDNAESKLE